MGLDTFAVMPIPSGYCLNKCDRRLICLTEGYVEKVELDYCIHLVKPEWFGGINLIGGMMSGNGDNSFRGKVYNDLIEEITGQSLYEEYIPPETVSEMADRLSEINSKGFEKYDKNLDFEDIEDLIKFFGVCKEKELGLYNWG